MKLVLTFPSISEKTYIECNGMTQIATSDGDSCEFDNLSPGEYKIRIYNMQKTLKLWNYLLIWLGNLLILPLRLLLLYGYDENGWLEDVIPFCFDQTFSCTVDGDTDLNVNITLSKVTKQSLFDTKISFEGNAPIEEVSSTLKANIPNVFAQANSFLSVLVWVLSAVIVLIIISTIYSVVEGATLVLSGIAILLLGLLVWSIVRTLRDAYKLKDRILNHINSFESSKENNA